MPARLRGNCYVASEALYHILGGKASGWKPMRMRVVGDTHWFLRHESGLVLDPSRLQFDGQGRRPDYSLAKRATFLTKFPSRRARKLMETLTWQQI